MPGTILSQLGMQIMRRSSGPGSSSRRSRRSARGWAASTSCPSWPMAMPSSTPIVLNTNGTPPAARTHSLTKLPTACRWTWPGMMSTWLLQIAMNGLSQSPSPTPVARSRLRWAARASPSLIMSERMVRLSKGMHDGRPLDGPILADASRPAKPRTRSSPPSPPSPGFSRHHERDTVLTGRREHDGVWSVVDIRGSVMRVVENTSERLVLEGASPLFRPFFFGGLGFLVLARGS